MEPSLLGLLLVVVAINVYVSLRVCRSHYYSSNQKAVQCLMIWLIPVLGPIGIWVFLRTQVGWEKYDTRAFPEPSKKMVVVEVSNSIMENLGGGTDASAD